MKWRVAGVAIVSVLAARLCFLFIGYTFDSARTIRPQVESAALLFVAAGFCLRAAVARRASVPVEIGKPPHPILLALMFAVALALYWPTLWIGYLSDDFILVQHAAAWQFGAVAPQLFRPVPLAVWAVLWHLGGGAVAVHLVNILLHALNAFLTARIVSAWISERWWPAAAGMLVLLSPLAPEAVAWGAGVFDVMSTTFALFAVLVARQYETAPSKANRFLLGALCGGALLSKESAAITPVLIALDGWVRGSLSRRLVQDLAVFSAGIGLFAALRLQSYASPVPFVSKYRLQRLTFDGFGTLANPWHLELFQSPQALSMVGGVSMVVLLTLFFLVSGSMRSTKAAASGGLWVLISLLPVLPLFYVSAALEGSRYLYLATIGWTAGLVVVAADVSSVGSSFRVVAATIIVIGIGMASYGTRVHLRPWIEAKTLRDLVLSVAARNSAMQSCDVLSLGGLPQSVKGAYVFSNGAREAFAEIGLNASVRNDSGACAFAWNSGTSQFERAGGRRP